MDTSRTARWVGLVGSSVARLDGWFIRLVAFVGWLGSWVFVFILVGWVVLLVGWLVSWLVGWLVSSLV